MKSNLVTLGWLIFACARKHVHSVSFSLMMVLLQVDFMHLKYLIDRTPFLQRLERENDLSLMGRVKKNDDLQSFYQHYYSKYIQALQNAADNTDRA
ncbi:hypothetical protein L1987_25462 [Smallanthus sonchifolius]|uniref:Uncharacterized protein n=1 Tax=Smallanthus sonchifolius TaxID=185202 RepID=A0ACB9IPS0_9ASTR|nr:hypothetical protein L1987_25462 [Smallanthus sonchifolius]